MEVDIKDLHITRSNYTITDPRVTYIVQSKGKLIISKQVHTLGKRTMTAWKESGLNKKDQLEPQYQ